MRIVQLGVVQLGLVQMGVDPQLLHVYCCHLTIKHVEVYKIVHALARGSCKSAGELQQRGWIRRNCAVAAAAASTRVRLSVTSIQRSFSPSAATRGCPTQP